LTAKIRGDTLKSAIGNKSNEISLDPDIIRENYLGRKYNPDRPAISLPERVSQNAFRGGDGRNLHAALEVAGRSLRSVRPSESGSREHREAFRKEVHAAERKACLTWARANGLLIDEAGFNRRWEADGRRGESEHQVYRDPVTGRWWKRNALNFHDGSISAYLERLAAQRAFFPEMAPRLEGFSTCEGDLMPVISQPDAKGTPAIDSQIAAHLKNLGFIEVFETGKGMGKAHSLAVEAGLHPPDLGEPKRVGFLLPSEGVWLEDVHEENAVVSPAGRLQVFDPVMHFIDMTTLWPMLPRRATH
jgi:hypothetical protein